MNTSVLCDTVCGKYVEESSLVVLPGTRVPAEITVKLTSIKLHGFQRRQGITHGFRMTSSIKPCIYMQLCEVAKTVAMVFA